jgi:hypothetical protein
MAAEAVAALEAMGARAAEAVSRIPAPVTGEDLFGMSFRTKSPVTVAREALYAADGSAELLGNKLSPKAQSRQ